MADTPAISSPTIPALALRTKEAAAALAVSERTLWGWTADPTSGIPHFRRGAVLLYPVRELQEWLASQSTGGKRGGK